MKPGRMGFHRAFSHGPEQGSYYYSPCPMCDYKTILLAKNVRSLHLGFGDSYRCVMHIIERTCKVAIENMQLQRLELTVSNIWRWDNYWWLGQVIHRINDATKETGRLLSVSSESFSAGSYTAGFASETWFWNATEGGEPLQWVDDWAKKCAYDAAKMKALYDKRKPGATAENPIVS
jgi:hypothetical protein